MVDLRLVTHSPHVILCEKWPLMHRPPRRHLFDKVAIAPVVPVHIRNTSHASQPGHTVLAHICAHKSEILEILKCIVCTANGKEYDTGGFAVDSVEKPNAILGTMKMLGR